MKKFIFFLVLFASVSFLFHSCKKETDKEEETVEGIGDSLSEEDNAYLETLSVPNPSLKEILGTDGKPLARIGGIQGLARIAGIRGDLIKALLTDAQQLSGQKIIQYPSAGDDKPAHMGLVYSYGQRDITQRLIPPSGNALHRKYAVFGTDCSGLQINLLRHAGINIADCSVSTFESELKAALEKNDTYKDFKVENKGYQPIDSLKSGDYILWITPSGNNHIGIIANLVNHSKTLYQSNGTGKPENEAAQTKNLGAGRGVHPISFPIATSNSYPWGNGYKVLRLNVDIEKLIKGKWSFVKSVLNHYSNGVLIDTEVENLTGTWDFLEDKTYRIMTTNEDCSGTYNLNQDIEQFTIAGGSCGNITFVIQKISATELELFSEGIDDDGFFRETWFLRK